MGPQIGLSRSAVKKSGMIVLQAFLLCSSDLLNVSKNSALSSHGSFLRWVCSEEGTSVLTKCLLSFLHTGCKGPTPQIINSHGSSNGSYGGGSNVQQVVVVCRGSEVGLG